MSITVLDLALHLGAKPDEDGSINGGEFEKVGLPMMGGCQVCGATIAAYNACPTKTGYLQGTCCVESTGQGFETVEEAAAFLNMRTLQ